MPVTVNRELSEKKERPVRVLQFGEGNFLRGFVDYFVDIANEKGAFDGDIAVAKPIPGGNLEGFRRQECQYTVLLRGVRDGEKTVSSRLVTCIADAVDPYVEYERYTDYAKLDTLRFIVSNTTEAGIVFDPEELVENTPQKSFPGKLTKLLYDRYRRFDGAKDKGLVMLPVELIENNGGKLRECVLCMIAHWGLEDTFRQWVEESCEFCSTLVDRIVTGYPRDEAQTLWEGLGYRDELIVTGEPFALWVIECSSRIKEEFPLDKAGLPVIFTSDQAPYRQRKVRILNGAHTSFALAAFLAGHDDVFHAMEDELFRCFVFETIFEEIIPTLDLPRGELEEFANAVVERFRNPYINHELLSISLNSVSKWRTRCLPSFSGYARQTGKLPERLAFSLAALAAFYSVRYVDGMYIGTRNGMAYRVQDDAPVLDFFAKYAALPSRELADALLGNEAFFGEDLRNYAGAVDAIASALEDIRLVGMRKAIERRFGRKEA